MAAILVLMGVIRQDWGSHKIQGATKESTGSWLVQVGVGTRSRSQQNMIDVF